MLLTILLVIWSRKLTHMWHEIVGGWIMVDAAGRCQTLGERVEFGLLKTSEHLWRRTLVWDDQTSSAWQVQITILIPFLSKYSEVLCLLHFLTSVCLGCVDNGVVFPFQQGWRGEVSGRAPGNVPWSPQWFLSTPLSLGHGFCDVCTQRRAHIQKQGDKRAWILRYIKVYSVLSEGCVRWV